MNIAAIQGCPGLAVNMTKTPAARVRNDKPSANVGVAKIRLEMRYLSLEELIILDIVKMDNEKNVVRKGPKIEEYLNKNSEQ